MKRLLTIAFLLISLAVNAQIVNIPDANFKAALIAEGVDTNNDGEIQVNEAENVVNMDVSNSEISSLEGIQSFINLEEIVADYNNISEVHLNPNSYIEFFKNGFFRLYNKLFNKDDLLLLTLIF